jgi:hypothetical protein
MKILQPAVNTAPYPLAQFQNNGPELKAWYQGAAQEDALNKNTNLRTEYLNGTFQNWLMNYDAGRVAGGDPNAPPPQPPNGFSVHVQDDGITIELVQDGPLVCSLPAYSKIPAPQTVEQAAHMLWVLGGGGNMTNAAPSSPFNSSVPIFGQPIVAADGSKWVRVA